MSKHILVLVSGPGKENSPGTNLQPISTLRGSRSAESGNGWPGTRRIVECKHSSI